jgi:hypothetical protein
MGRYTEELTLAEVLADPEFAQVIARVAPQLEDRPFLKIVKGKKISELRKLIPNPEMKEHLELIEEELKNL